MRFADCPAFKSFEADYFDHHRHRSALAALSAEALNSQLPILSYGFAYRLCAVPAPKARDVVLRALALIALGEKELAHADLARALEIDPTDEFVLKVVAGCADVPLSEKAEQFQRNASRVEPAPMNQRSQRISRRRLAGSRAAFVTAIVPVYGAPEETAACLYALFKEGSRRLRRIIVVDDASPQLELRRWLDAQAAQRRIVLLRNDVNRGFAASVNRALALCETDDVLLLNSDAYLPLGAINALAEAAHANDAIGTVTPLSNNGEWTSFPEPFQVNPAPSPEQIESLMRSARSANASGVVDLPTGVGFCLYITRDCLDAVPHLPELYGRGYCEDVEYALLAREAGFRNVCATGVYVGHAGSRSFRGEKRAFALRNLATLQSRFPDHALECAAFLAADPLRPACARLAGTTPTKALRPGGDAIAPTPFSSIWRSGGGALGIWLPTPSAKAERLLVRLARTARLRGRTSFVVFGRTFDDLALMAPGNLFVAGPLGEAEAQAVAARFDIGAWLSPLRPDAAAALDLARDTGRPYARFVSAASGLAIGARDLGLPSDLTDEEAADRCLDWFDGLGLEIAA